MVLQGDPFQIVSVHSPKHKDRLKPGVDVDRLILIDAGQKRGPVFPAADLLSFSLKLLAL